MVMLGPRCPEVGFSSDQEIVQTFKAPHHSSTCTQDQSNTEILLPPLELHDPVIHALEESYLASTHAWRKLSLFLLFSCMSQSRVSLCFKVAHCVTQHHDKSVDYLSCTCTQLGLVGTLNHEVWLSSMLYLSWLLVRTTGLLTDKAFTNMGLPMRWWLHWKYHFTWLGPCTTSVGVGVLFSFSCLLHACLLTCFICLFVCFIVCLLASLSFFLLLLLCFVDCYSFRLFHS